MTIITYYLVRLFLARFLLVIAVLSILAGMLDVVANADDILAATGSGPFSLFRYAGLRFPEIVTNLIPLSVLLGVMLTYVSLMHHNEMPALKSAGMSQFYQMAIFVPVAALIAMGQFWLQDQIMPRTIGALYDWGVGDYRTSPSGDGERSHAIWMREGDILVRARWISPGGDRMEGVTIFRRNGEGNLVEQIDALEAARADRGWILHNVARLNVAQNNVLHVNQEAWDVELPARLLSSLSKDPKQLTVAELNQFLGIREFGNRPRYFYKTWLQEKLSTPIGTILMVLLAVPLAQGQERRRRKIVLMVIAGVAIGFLYLVFDGLALSLGGAGLLPPFLAAWAPILVFLSIAGALAFRHERR
jgi:lipopolysaccharide export system permease protein